MPSIAGWFHHTYPALEIQGDQASAVKAAITTILYTKGEMALGN